MDPKILRLLKNYSNARKSWEAWCYMANFRCARSQHEIRDYITDNPLLFHLRYLAMKDFYIEMYKILKQSKNNNGNIFKLLKEYVGSNSFNNENAISNLSALEACSNIIDRICNLRDKFYAHLDKNYEDYIQEFVNMHDIEDCFEVIETSIITLTSLETLNTYLDNIPSRNDFSLTI